MGQVVAWVWIMEIGGFLDGDWWVATVTDDGSLMITDDGLDAV